MSGRVPSFGANVSQSFPRRCKPRHGCPADSVIRGASHASRVQRSVCRVHTLVPKRRGAALAKCQHNGRPLDCPQLARNSERHRAHDRDCYFDASLGFCVAPCTYARGTGAPGTNSAWSSLCADLCQVVTLEVAAPATLSAAFSSDGGGSFSLNTVTAMAAASPGWDETHQLVPVTEHDPTTFGQRLRVKHSSLAGSDDALSLQHVPQTLEAWVKVLDVGSGGSVTLLGEGAAGGKIMLHDLRYGSTDGVGHMGLGGHCVSNSSAGPVPVGVWLHLVAVFGGDNGADCLFMNGNLVDTVLCNSTSGWAHGVPDPVLALATLPPWPDVPKSSPWVFTDLNGNVVHSGDGNLRALEYTQARILLLSNATSTGHPLGDRGAVIGLYTPVLAATASRLSCLIKGSDNGGGLVFAFHDTNNFFYFAGSLGAGPVQTWYVSHRYMCVRW